MKRKNVVDVNKPKWLNCLYPTVDAVKHVTLNGLSIGVSRIMKRIGLFNVNTTNVEKISYQQVIVNNFFLKDTCIS